jgi:formylglycine-generating enzyme required for sulfatase activity
VWRTFLMMGLSLLLAAQAALAQAQPGKGKGIALVIGNGAYLEQPLPGPAQDADAMATALRRQGYTVLLHRNLKREQMLQALHDFERRLQAGGEGLFYFAGHGMQVGQRVLLLPVDAVAAQPARLLADALDLDTVLQRLASGQAGKARLVLLDACLDNPFQAPALAPPVLPPQTLVAYAARPGHAAFGNAGQGLWTAALLRAMAAGGNAHALLAGAAAQVAAGSGGMQRPWLQSTLSGEAVRMASMPLLAAVDVDGPLLYRRGVLPKDSAEQYELTFWDSIKDSNHASDYEAYLQAYPNGRFAGLARARVERLKAAAPRQEAPRPEAPRPAPEKSQAPPRPAAKKPADSVPPGAAPAAAPDAARAAAPQTQPALRKAGTDIQDCPACPVLAAVPAGSFTMGNNSSDPSEKPTRRLTMDKPFAIGRTEVTVQQWNACVEAGACPRVVDAQRAPNLPVGDISWDDAQIYVQWLTKVSGKPYRLPTEAEWEYAARGGTASRYWWGEDMKRGAASCKECGEPWQEAAPAPAGSFTANGYGLHDMSGSLWEWVQDCWHSSYKNAPADARAWEEAFCRQRVIRGGSWRDGASYMPASTRFKYDASVRHSQNGFRVARDLD